MTFFFAWKVYSAMHFKVAIYCIALLLQLQKKMQYFFYNLLKSIEAKAIKFFIEKMSYPLIQSFLLMY